MANPYEAPKSDARAEEGFKAGFRISYGGLLLAILVVAVAVVFLLPLAQTAVWNGSYTLTVVLQPKSDLGSATPRFALCQTPDEATKLEQGFPDSEYYFEPARLAGKHAYNLHVRVSGRTNFLGREYTTYEDKWFVIMYETADGASHRKAVSIIKGPRPRMMRVELP